MRRRHNVLLAILALLYWLSTSVLAQDEDKPLALLRVKPMSEDYYINVQTNAELSSSQKLSVIIANKSSLVIWEEDVKNCQAATAGRPCYNRNQDDLIDIVYQLPQRPRLTDKFRVNFAIFDTAGRGTFRTMDVTTDLKAGGPRVDVDCPNGLLIELQFDNPAIEGNATEEAYYRSRLEQLRRWLQSHKPAPSGVAKVRVEPLTQANLTEYTVRSYSVVPAADPQSASQDLDVERALGFQKVFICLQFHDRLPNEKFNAEVSLQKNVPFELEKPLVKAVTPPADLTAPVASKIMEDNKVGVRSIENNLDVGGVLTSSVKDVKKDDKVARERQTRGSLDLRFAPLLRGRLSPPEVRKWQRFWTPIFIDAKVSDGKLSEDTLSMNRILVGTEVAFRYLTGSERGARDKYVIALRAVNASDRDFKRVEAKGEIEFRPLFEILNQPLKVRHTSLPAVLIPDSPPKVIPAGNFFGYQIQPFVGVEIGGVYRKNRKMFKGDEQTDAVRRISFGVDAVFNLTPRFTLTLTDIFYIRGESSDDRGHNYFNGSIEIPLGNLSRYVAQNVFFSFERGAQPPFATPDVNALKLGYRIRSTFFGLGPGR